MVPLIRVLLIWKWSVRIANSMSCQKYRSTENEQILSSWLFFSG
jgi:hypothetical protein